MTHTTDIVGCLACDLISGRRNLPGGRILTTENWIVEHCFGPLGVGTLLVKPLRHVTGVGELNVEEATELGPLLQRAAAVVDELVQPARTYDIDSIGGYGPTLQVGMFERNEYPPVDEVEAFADEARKLFADA